MMSSEEDNECFGLFTDDKTLLKTTLALNSSSTTPLAVDISTSAICTELTAKIEIASSTTSPNLLNLDEHELRELQEQQQHSHLSKQQQQRPLTNGVNNDLLYKEEKFEKRNSNSNSRDTNTTAKTATNNHHDQYQAENNDHKNSNNNDIYVEEEEENILSSVNVNNNNSTNDEGDDEVIFLFGQQQQEQSNTLNTFSTACTTTTNTSSAANNKNTASAALTTTTTTTTSTTTTTTTTTKNNTTSSSPSTFTNNTQQQVVTDVDDNLESSHKGAVNKTTSSLSSCGLNNFRNSLNTLHQVKNSNKLNNNNTNSSSVGSNNTNNRRETKFKVNNNVANSSLKIKLSKSPLNSSCNLITSNTNNLFSEATKQVNDFCSKLTSLNANNLNLNNSSNDCLINSLEDLQQQQKSDFSVFSSLPNFINQLRNSTSPQLLGQTPAVLTPSTAAALMSSAAAAAAGAAGQALYGALLNSSQQQQQSSTSSSPLNNKTFSCNNNNLNTLHSPNSGSVSSSPTSSLLTGQFTAALGNLFGANGFGSAKMLNELFGRQMKQAQDATSGLPTSLDNAMLAAAMESATNAELLSAANLVSSLGLNNSNKLLNNNNISSNNTGNHLNEQQISPQAPSSKNRRTSNCSERSLEENGLAARSQDLISSPPRTPSVGNSSMNGVVSTTSGAPNSPSLQQQQNDLAHHMLRNILQGKKELMQLDQELRSVISQQQQMKENQDSTLKHNNNNSSLANNNNNSESKENSSNVINLIEDSMSEIKIKSEPLTQPTPVELMNGTVTQERRKSSDSEDLQSQHDLEDHQSEVDHLDNNDPEQIENGHLNLPAQVTKKEADDILEDVELMGLNSRSDLESLASPSQSDLMLLENSKDDMEEEMDKDLNPTMNKKSDLKRARVENIVSTMRSSPSSQNLQVNGCKKRKLYQPQQHAMERYVAAAAGLNFGLNLQSMMLTDDNDSDENESPQIQQKRNEKNALKSQLRSMQEQLAEMQQKYVQLCSRIEHESDCQEIEDNNSDSMEPEDNNGDLSPSPSLNDAKQNVDNERASSNSPSLNLKNAKHSDVSNSSMNLDANPNNVLSQMMSKMISGKLHNPLAQHTHMPQSFNAPLPLLQHMPQLQTPEGGLTHPAISNAAAMYLGQQFFFEQEARIAKEAAEQQQQQQAQQQQQQLQQQQAQQQQEQQEQQRRFEQDQQQRRKEEQAQQHQQQQQQQLQRQHQLQQLQQQQHQQEQQTLQQPSRPQLHHNRHHGRHNTALKTELSEKFNMLRTSSNSIMRMSGADLEGLADVLKSEITTSLSALVDTIVTRFVHQRRLFSKQSDSVAAAAEQLNKDLLLASQILDRKSPRTKQSERSNNNSTNSSQSAQSSTGVNAGNNGTLLLVNNNNTNSSTNSLNNNPNTNSNSNISQQQAQQQQLGHLHSNVSNTGPPLLTAGPVNSVNVNVNVPQQHINNPCQTLVPSTANQVVTPNMAAQLNAQTCQSLIAAPRLNGSQLSFPSPAAAAAAAMGLQMHHAAAAAAMSAAAAASGQQQNLQALNQVHHAQNLNEANSVNVNVNMANLSSNNSNNNNSKNLNSMNTNNNNNNSNNNTNNNSLSTINIPPPHIRPSPTAAAMFQAPKTPQGINPVAAAALYNSMTGGQVGPMQPNPFCMPEPRDQQQQQQQQHQQQQQQQQQQQLLEQNEALSLVVTPKKKRHKVTDTRITPRTVSRILAQDGMVPPSPQNNGQNLQSNQNNGPCNNSINNNMNPASLTNNNMNNNHNNCNSLNVNGLQQQQQQLNNNNNSNNITTPAQSPSPRGQAPANYHPQAPPPPPPPMMPVSLPTSVAIPNPSLHESQVFSPYSPFFNPHPPHAPPPPPHGPHSGSHAPPTAAQMHHMKLTASPPGGLASLMDSRDGSPPLPPHPSTMLHPALLAAAHHGGSPDYSAHLRAAMDAQDRSSDCNSADMQFEGMQPTISFLKQQMIKNSDSLTTSHSSTLTPMHLRKAKLMFFWVRYPSSSVLKMYFPDIKFNKNNTAQLVKWFSNFREFYYIQMEKYARQAVTEGVKCAEDLHISGDSELYRVLNLHYNRNNHIEVPQNFRFVVEQTLREFFRAIQGGKDTEQSWKKSIYKIISRLDDPVPEYFKSPNFLEQLE